MVSVLQAVNVTIQNKKKAEKLIVHIDKLKPYMGDAPVAWVVDDSLDVTGGNQTASLTPPDFSRAFIPNELNS